VSHPEGAFNLFALGSDGSLGLRMYATRGHALAAGVDAELVVDLLFRGVREDGAEVEESCIKRIGPSGDDPMGKSVVSCTKKSCRKKCIIYSMQKPEKGDPVPDLDEGS
jgi:hypothetical protein